MQIKAIFLFLSSARFIRLIKILLIIFVLAAIYLIISSKQKNISTLWLLLIQTITLKNIWLLLLLLFLTPLNWAFEAWKWQKLASKIEKINFLKAYQAVLVGLSLGISTPMMLGDYAGKIGMLASKNRMESIGAILLGNGIQTYISLIFGTFSYIFFINHAQLNLISVHFIMAFLLILASLLGVLMAFNLHKISYLIEKYQFTQAIKKYLQILENFSITDLQKIFFIAFGRYLVFVCQFLLVFQIFQINLPFEVLFAGIGMIFFAKTLASAFNFIGDLSLRSLTAVYYFNHFDANLSIVAMATLLIWLINVLFPVLVGSIFIWKLKIST
jgi:hypothetical protein